MRLMALMMIVLGLMASGSAKAAGAPKICGMVIEMAANANVVVIVVKTDDGKRELSTLDSRISANTNIVNIATAAMNNPGSLDFCADVNEKKQIVSASVSNRFKK